MASTILRKSSSIFSRRFFAAVTSVEPLLTRHNSHALSSAVYCNGNRLFHAKSGPLNFHSSLVSRGAQLALDYDDDVQHDEGDEGLEIAKLGISKEIVKALAKKSITKLFPIQVWLCAVFFKFLKPIHLLAMKHRHGLR